MCEITSKFWKMVSSFELNEFSETCFVSSFRDTSGQGRFCTIFRSYSRGAQVHIILTFDSENSLKINNGIPKRL